MQIQLSQILFQLLNFGVVLAGLSYLLYKPIIKLLDERATRIAAAEKAAAEAHAEKASIDELKKKAKIEAEKEAAKLLDKAKEDAAALKKELVKKAKDELAAEHEKAVKGWAAEQKSQIDAMHKEFAQAVYAVSEKVIGEAIDKKAHAALIDKGLKELAKVM